MNESEVIRSNIRRLQGDSTIAYNALQCAVCCDKKLRGIESALLQSRGLVLWNGIPYKRVKEVVRERYTK